LTNRFLGHTSEWNFSARRRIRPLFPFPVLWYPQLFSHQDKLNFFPSISGYLSSAAWDWIFLDHIPDAFPSFFFTQLRLQRFFHFPVIFSFSVISSGNFSQRLSLFCLRPLFPFSAVSAVHGADLSPF